MTTGLRTEPASPPPPEAGPYGAAQPPRGTRLLADAKEAGITLLVLVLLGAPVGLVWSALSPHVQVVLSGAGASIAMPETEDFIGADGRFVFVALVVGALSGVVAYLLARRRSPLLVLALAAGGLLAAYVAARAGMELGRDGFRAALLRGGTSGTLHANVRLRAHAALLIWPATAVLAFLLAALRSPQHLD